MHPSKFDPTIRVSADTTKTPFVKHFADDGVVYSCVYSNGAQLALIALFCEPENLQISGPVSVRLHSSCANSDILGSFDCDCRSQLVLSLKILREERGILIHLFQEGRGAGLFAKYLGMYTMQAQRVSTYKAYENLSIEVDRREYSLAFTVLRDLSVGQVSLLSNNPKKIGAFNEAGFLSTARPLIGTITPQNFGYLYSKFSEGKHALDQLFPNSGDYFFCQTKQSAEVFHRVWILDGDDTLWEDNIVYMRIISQFIDHCRSHNPTLDETVLRRIIDETEMKTIPQHGFGAPGFKHSLELVYASLAEGNVVIPYPTELFDAIIPTLSRQPEVIVADAMTVLRSLRDRGDGLVLYTQGPLHIQLRKVCNSGMAESFHAICVVRTKSDDTLQRLRQDFSVASGNFVSVGNSLRSDIEPALRNGMKAVHYLNPNSWHMQNVSEVDRSQYQRIARLSELLDAVVGERTPTNDSKL